MSQTTKRALAASLKKLLAEKPLDKITVTDVAEDCGVNRQTFYYHFQDIYDLVEWIFLTDAQAVVGEDRTADTWQRGYLRVFDYLRENRALALNAYRSVSRRELERFLHQVSFELLTGVVEECAQGLSLRDEDKAFTANFYKYGLTGLVLDWLDGGMRGDPETLVAELGRLLRGNIRGGLERLARGNGRE